MTRGLAAPLALALGLMGGASHAQIQGPLRDAFRISFVKACVASQRSNPANHGLNANVLSAYCGCTAAYIADRASAEQFTQAAATISKDGEPDWLASLRQGAADYCPATLSRYRGVQS